MGSASRTSSRSATDKVAVAGQQLAMRVNSAQAYHFRGNRGQTWKSRTGGTFSDSWPVAGRGGHTLIFRYFPQCNAANPFRPVIYCVSPHSNDTTNIIPLTVKPIYVSLVYGFGGPRAGLLPLRAFCVSPPVFIFVSSLFNVVTPLSFSRIMFPSNPFRNNTYRIVWKCSFQKTYSKAKSFRMRTYKKSGGGGHCFLSFIGCLGSRC
jgi:hypothetical protein